MMKTTTSLFLILEVMLVGLLGACSASVGRAQKPVYDSTIEPDPGFLEQYAATYRFRLGHPKSISITSQGDAVLFLRSGPRSFAQNLYSFDISAGKERLLVSADQLLAGEKEQLSAEELARRERMRMGGIRGISSYQLSEDGSWLLVSLSGNLYVINRLSGKIQPVHLGNTEYPLSPRLSPDASRVAYVQQGDLYVSELRSGKITRLTKGAKPHLTQGLAEFVAQEEMRRYQGFWWSPDSQWVAYQQTDTTEVERLHIFDPMHPEKPPQAWPYPRAGKPNAKIRLGVVRATGGKTTWVKWNQKTYPYLATVKWKASAPLTILVQNRSQTEEVLYKVDPTRGVATALLTERDEAWLNLDQQMPYWLEDGSGFLWTSERSGKPQLEHRDHQGNLLGVLIPQDWTFRKLLSVDRVQKKVYVVASKDPTQQHIICLPLEPSRDGPATLVSQKEGLHYAYFSKNHQVFTHFRQALRGKEQVLVRKIDGSIIAELTSLAEKPRFKLELELATVGKRAFRAALIRPRSFRPDRRYPVLAYVYAGPGHQSIKASTNNYLLQQWMADHGFVVVMLDGRGTPGRGRTWERAIKGNLIQVALKDQVAGLKALGDKYPELDLGRVGIYGWSFGGTFSAMAVLRRPDVYHAAIAVAPVVDWLDYDTHYTERFLGLPQDNPEGYKDSSVLSFATKLSRPLLLIHGTADDNVYFNHSMKFSDALFRAGKIHEFLPLSGFTHSIPDPLVITRLYTRMAEFFQKHL